MSVLSGGIKNWCHSTADAVSEVPERGKDQFLGPADYTLVKTAQDADGRLSCKDTLPHVQLIHVQLVYQASPVHLFKDAAYIFACQPVLLIGVIPSQIEDFAFASDELFVEMLSTVVFQIFSEHLH